MNLWIKVNVIINWHLKYWIPYPWTWTVSPFIYSLTSFICSVVFPHSGLMVASLMLHFSCSLLLVQEGSSLLYITLVFYNFAVSFVSFRRFVCLFFCKILLDFLLVHDHVIYKLSQVYRSLFSIFFPLFVLAKTSTMTLKSRGELVKTFYLVWS